ncbi:hypothetical protein PRIPAC_81612 [Pristionchus pacificus]|nr:hypothetical protein PRIPAC_81612 [Pristionchus pacificus]
MDEAGSSQHCLVCTVTISVTRFGMDVCRACSSFFKRTKVKGQNYTCRQGDRKCSTSKDEKFTCRGCRYEKCVYLGMEYNGPIRERRKHIPILKMIRIELKSLFERRREQELKIIKHHGGHTIFPHTTEELYYPHRESFMEIYGIFFAESFEFFKKVFPAFSALSDKEQELIFKDYIGKLCMIEDYRRSVQLWGSANEKHTYSVTTCFEVNNLLWHGIDENMEHKNFLKSYTAKHTEEKINSLHSIFTKCKFTEKEYNALIALVIYEIDSDYDLSNEAETILENYRRETLEELQLYYKKELCLRDYSTRLGNIMSANHIIQDCKSRSKTFYRFYFTMFEVFMADNVLKKIYL